MAQRKLVSIDPPIKKLSATTTGTEDSPGTAAITPTSLREVTNKSHFTPEELAMLELLLVPPPIDNSAKAPLVQQVAGEPLWTREGPIKGVFVLCHVMPSYDNDAELEIGSSYRGLSPTVEAFGAGRFHTPLRLELNGAKKETLLKGPKHGTLTPPVAGDRLRDWVYTPNRGFVGTDNVEFMVKGRDDRLDSAVEFKLIYQLKVTREKHPEHVKNPDLPEKYCPQYVKPIRFKDNMKWFPVSQNEFYWDANLGVSPSTDNTSGLQGYYAILPALAAAKGAGVVFSNLNDGALGAAGGEGSDALITLSSTGAGHGWFIDPTPGVNEEFLPTSNPNEWIAKEGSAAYGKMDMLTVLLHEYGHVLGIDHNADAHDFMATTLQPGMRRTLSVDQQLELMQLAGYFPTPDSPSEPQTPGSSLQTPGSTNPGVKSRFVASLPSPCYLHPIMSRPIRIEFPNAIYHVTARGDRREHIFEDDPDRQLFLATLEQTISQFNWICHAWCLMDNHYHLLIQTPDGNLSKGMRQLNGIYTQASNRRHRRVGHLFQGRFKAILVDSDAYLLELTRYVVLNPVRAGIVTTVAKWPWSSYRACVGLETAAPWLAVDGLLAQFAKRRSLAQARYAQFVAEGIKAASPWSNIKGQVFLGDDQFVQRMQAHLQRGKDDVQVPLAQRRPPPPPLADIEQKSADRNTAIVTAYATGGYSYQQLADYFGVHFTTVGRIVRAER